jgi:hypothetical protein
LGVTAVTWAQFSGAGTYTAGTGLTLTGTQFSLTAPVTTALGGTGSTSALTQYGVVYGSTISVMATTSAGTSTQVLHGNASGAPTWGAVSLTADVSSTLPIANGGTNSTATATAGGVGYGTGTAHAYTVAGTSNQVLISNGASAPSWSSLSSIGVTSINFASTGLTPATATSGAITVAGTLVVGNGGTGLTTLTAGYIPYGAGTSAFGSVSTLNYNATNTTFNAPVLGTTSFTSTTPSLSFNASNSNMASGATVAGSYLQNVLQNKSGTAGASTNYVLSNELGTDSTYYGEFGMNSSVFSASTPVDFFSINNGVYFSGHDGDITVGSGNGFKYYMAWGTSGQSAHVINANGALGFTTNLGTTPALSGTTGYGTAGQVLVSAGSAASPAWGNVNGGTF